MKEQKYTNELINETSPYLLQHAYNPVDWHPWNEETLEKAKNEGKLLLISIGYSACHWCHVMEHESFEDEEIAEYMNQNFINIKVDREERPDIDQVYMNAVQLMTKSGGWPLNCIALPDGKPIWGGTYFPKETWLQQIQQVHKYYTEKPNEVIDYADKLAQGIQQSELIILNEQPAIFSIDKLNEMVAKWQNNFDTIYGGENRSPKFPLPNNYLFLMRYSHLTNDKKIKKHVRLTLKQMAYGGIYDQIGGGFSRYAVDAYWKVPHFEKMLYDNAQLVSLYSEAFIAYKEPLYKKIIEETLLFITRELTDDNGAFYSALDADSEGEEGKFYIWKKSELEQLIGGEYSLFKDYYNINKNGLWEDGNYILLKTEDQDNFSSRNNITSKELEEKVLRWKKILLKERSNRKRPGLDDKTLTSWNGLMCKAFVDAYMALGNTEYLDAAIKNANFIISKQIQVDGSLLHSYKEGTSRINGYLEDYAFSISAFIRLYEATFNQDWLKHAEKLTDYTIQYFLDKESNMFFFTSNIDDPLIARKMETRDNVIPASNSEIANSLYLLSEYLEKPTYLEHSTKMLNNIQNLMPEYGSGYSNWGVLLLNRITPFYQVAIVGRNAEKISWDFNQTYHPNKLLVGSNNGNCIDRPSILDHKWIENATTIYVCENKVCQMPIIFNEIPKLTKEEKEEKIKSALELIK